MSLADPPVKTMTAEDLMALPDDGIDRWIINGVLIERPGEFCGRGFKGHPMTLRNRVHSEIEAKLAKFLGVWLDRLPEPRGKISCGEVGFRLQSEPETYVGIDVAFASAELVRATGPSSAFYEGPPALAVEILSPSDQYGDVADKVEEYLKAGSVVWVLDPRFRRISVHKPGKVTETYNDTQELSGDPELPGFRVRVADLFS